MINVKNLNYSIRKKQILKEVKFSLKKGNFLAVLGENGAGKTTLLDILMGFIKPDNGSIEVFGSAPINDVWHNRQKTVYLSEKVDIPGDWTGDDFLEFNKFFYVNYNNALEKELLETFKVDKNQRTGNCSAGELRRLQIVGALSTKPELIIIDEITAVLDILGRVTFLKTLKTLQKTQELTVVLATNIPEGLENYATDILLLNNGISLANKCLSQFMGKEKSLSEKVMEELETCSNIS